MFNYTSGTRAVVSALLCLLGQFFALWPDAPSQGGSFRSALKVDELTIILTGCMRACGSTSPRMMANPSRLLSTPPCGVVDCIILREVVCSFGRVGILRPRKPGTVRVRGSWKWRIIRLQRRRSSRPTGGLPSKRTRSMVGIGGASLPIWTSSLLSDIRTSLSTQSASRSYTR